MHFIRLMIVGIAIAVLAGCASDKNNGSVGIRMSDLSAGALSGQGETAGLAGGSGLSVPTDLWDRIRQGFAIPDLDDDFVRTRESWYASHPEQVERLFTRSNKYLYHIVEELERRHMPTELALLPFVESSFNPQAISSAKAAGIWQFIPSTGKHYSLRQNMFLDDRRDVLRSTRAALDYLQRLYTMFGDWQLALAAYNWGEGNLQRALQRNPGARYQDLKMPLETRQYVPRLQAIKNIVRNPATFNASLPNVANHPYFDRVDINRDIDVSMVAQLAGISEDDFRALNPALNKPLVIASLTPRILLPWKNVDAFRQNLAQASSKSLSSWTVWTVPSNMTVAQAAKSSGVDEGVLRSVNRIPPRMMVKGGSTLLVPRTEGQTSDISSLVAQTGSLSFTPEIVLVRGTIKARRGDTLGSFAARYGLPPENVAAWNHTDLRAPLYDNQPVVVNVSRAQLNRLQKQEREEQAEAAREARKAQMEAEQARRKARLEAQREEEDARRARRRRTAASRNEEQDTEAPTRTRQLTKQRRHPADTQDDEDTAKKPVHGKTRSKAGRDTADEQDTAPAKGSRKDRRSRKDAAAEQAPTSTSRKGKPATAGHGKAQATEEEDNSRDRRNGVKSRKGSALAAQRGRQTDEEDDAKTSRKSAAKAADHRRKSRATEDDAEAPAPSSTRRKAVNKKEADKAAAADSRSQTGKRRTAGKDREDEDARDTGKAKSRNAKAAGRKARAEEEDAPSAKSRKATATKSATKDRRASEDRTSSDDAHKNKKGPKARKRSTADD
ncbi:transglycosylase SLT domain-containing protein [Brachymonas sp.]|uniref:transglycosylase SLT domain-containing protein n=1 Tax=Brachymonas sp. TaxID=1936292 RepID=UPI0035B26685